MLPSLLAGRATQSDSAVPAVPYEYCRRGLFADVSLIVGDTTHRCHRVVLASASPHFHEQLLSYAVKEEGKTGDSALPTETFAAVLREDSVRPSVTAHTARVLELLYEGWAPDGRRPLSLQEAVAVLVLGARWRLDALCATVATSVVAAVGGDVEACLSCLEALQEGGAVLLPEDPEECAIDATPRLQSASDYARCVYEHCATAARLMLQSAVAAADGDELRSVVADALATRGESRGGHTQPLDIVPSQGVVPSAPAPAASPIAFIRAALRALPARDLVVSLQDVHVEMAACRQAADTGAATRADCEARWAHLARNVSLVAVGALLQWCWESGAVRHLGIEDAVQSTSQRYLARCLPELVLAVPPPAALSVFLVATAGPAPHSQLATLALEAASRDVGSFSASWTQHVASLGPAAETPKQEVESFPTEGSGTPEQLVLPSRPGSQKRPRGEEAESALLFPPSGQASQTVAETTAALRRQVLSAKRTVAEDTTTTVASVQAEVTALQQKAEAAAGVVKAAWRDMTELETKVAAVHADLTGQMGALRGAIAESGTRYTDAVRELHRVRDDLGRVVLPQLLSRQDDRLWELKQHLEAEFRALDRSVAAAGHASPLRVLGGLLHPGAEDESA